MRERRVRFGERDGGDMCVQCTWLLMNTQVKEIIQSAVFFFKCHLSVE